MKMPRNIGPVHFIGIGGIGMSGIAEILHNQGYVVQGSDAALNPNVQRLRIVQQCRAEDLDRVAETYRQAKINVELAAFFTDLPERVAKSHLVIARSGASTVAELTVLGRPSILIPLPGSLDADQKNNALVVENAGAGWIVDQATLSPQSLASRLTTLLTDPATLTRAADAARSLGQPRAVEKLADLAEMLSGKNIEVDHRT